MRPVQFILIIMLIMVVFLYFNRLRSGILDRVLVVAFAVAGMVMAALPDLTMKMAAVVGVGRGADLFMYLALIGFGFFGLVLYSKIRSLEGTITDLARIMAIRDARTPDEAPSSFDKSPD